MNNKEYVVKKTETGLSVSQFAETKKEFAVFGYDVNKTLVHPNYKVKEGDRVSFFPLTTATGYNIYLKSLVFLLKRAFTNLFPEDDLEVESNVSRSIYCYLRNGRILTERELKRLKKEMLKFVDKDVAFQIEEVSRTKLQDNLNLSRYEKKLEGTIPLYSLDGGEKSYFYSPLVNSVGVLRNFDLKAFMPGFLLMVAKRTGEEGVFPFKEIPKFFEALEESERWNNLIGVGYVSSLNKRINEGQGRDIIIMGEALLEKKITYISDYLSSRKKMFELILISGPSSSGKTTFSNKLKLALKVNGSKPITLSMDDYYINRVDTPLDENGEPDFESVKSIDLELFQDDLEKLILGEEILVPTYNFKTGEREYRGEKLRKDPLSPIIIEGIHGLNEELTSRIPRHLKYLIYVSALAAVNMDSYNFIRTTDARLVRRVIRDARDRNISAEETLKLWGRVRKGEENYVFPYQENADVFFNSHLPYELSVLKVYGEPLLKEIKKDSEVYILAQKLLRMLSYFEPLEDAWVPPFSILREIIGRGKEV